MNEMYWITRIVSLGEILNVVSILGSVVIGMMIILAPMLLEACKDLEKESRLVVKKILRIFCVVYFISLMGNFFIPSKKELLLIYGVGGTIDYIKTNEKAKQLPEKCIDALTRYVDSIEKENTNN